MPHGALTPLGRQLRSVLAGLGRSPTWSTTAEGRRFRGARGPGGLPARVYHESPRIQATAAVAEARDVWFDDAPAKEDTSVPDSARSNGTRRVKRRTRRSYLTEGLRTAGHSHAIPRPPKSKTDLSHINVARRDGWQRHRANAERHRLDARWDLERTTDLMLERIVASFLQHKSKISDIGQAEWDAPQYRFTYWESSFLTKKGYGRKDIEAWAEVVSTKDSHAAAELLAALVLRSKSKLVPVFLLTYLLRRPYIQAHALLLLLDVIPKMVESHQERYGRPPTDNTVFIVFVRLLRHAREVAPTLMQPIADILLADVPKVGATDSPTQLENITVKLNKAMHLISLSTAANPYKDVAHQEVAIVRILRYMTEHSPQLQITREGYRAVVRIQLTQKKTSAEQQWAELKALSWPPWKQDRTAMDAGITADEHGITTAAATLRRMREAGYAATEWEKTAQLFAGWDVDGTPTVQVRALLGSGLTRFRSVAPVWAARIASTRTAQEAWAAYIAFEDAQLPDSEDVHLAILQRLHGEEKRQRAEHATAQRAEDDSGGQRVRLLAGDTKEVQPLPPSTHLYTYTRMPVPDVEGFVRHLQTRNVILRRHALAFAVANASRLRLGFWYLHNALDDQPEIAALLSLDPLANTAEVPDVVFDAFIELLCRYSNVPLNNVTLRSTNSPTTYGPARGPFLDNERLNPHHPIVHAIEILRARGTFARPPWLAVLRALARDATILSMRFVRADTLIPTVTPTNRHVLEARGALTAFRLVRRVLQSLGELHVDLDTHGLHCLCIAAENTTLACWTILRKSMDGDLHDELPGRSIVAQAKDTLRGSGHTAYAKTLFKRLVGGARGRDLAAAVVSEQGTHETERVVLPRPLRTPSAALLHAYARALGWSGEYKSLLVLVKWMVAHWEELRVEHARERGGRDLLRRTIVAVRVFLERSWLNADLEDSEDADDTRGVTRGLASGRLQPGQSDGRSRQVRQLEAAAPTELVTEAEALVNSVEEWDGWPTDEEVERYCRNERFERIRSLSGL